MLINNDKELSDLLSSHLESQGISVECCKRFSDALELVKIELFDLVLLNTQLEYITPTSAITELQRNSTSIKIIVIAPQDSTQIQLSELLQSGAADTLTYPIDLSLMDAKIVARLRNLKDLRNIYKTGEILVDDKKKKVTYRNNPVSLTPREYKLLKYLIINSHRVLSREMILSWVWSDKPYIESRIVDVYIGYLRKKIDNGTSDSTIETVRGFGYRIADSDN